MGEQLRRHREPQVLHSVHLVRLRHLRVRAAAGRVSVLRVPEKHRLVPVLPLQGPGGGVSRGRGAFLGERGGRKPSGGQPSSPPGG